MKTTTKLSLALAFAAMALASCEPKEPIEGPNNGGGNTGGSSMNDITTPTVWTADMDLVIDRTVAVNADLTIEPGTVVKFKSDGRLEFGSGAFCTLTALGTEEEPITFKDYNGNNWGGLGFYSNASKSSAMKYCVVRNAGSPWHAAVEIHSTKITIENCSFAKGVNNGLYVNYDGGLKSFKYNTIAAYTGHAVQLDANAVSALDTTNLFATEGNKGIKVNNGDLTENATWNKLSVPYYVECIDIDNAELTIMPGAEFRFAPGGDFEVGYYNNAKFTAVGTEQEPIIFTSAATTPSEGDWIGLRFYEHTARTSIMEHCKVMFAGSNYYDALEIHSTQMTINNCVFEKGIKRAFYLNDEAKFVEFKNNTLREFGNNHLMYINANAVATIDGSNELVTDGNYGIHIYGSNVTANATWQKQTLPYFIESIDVDNAELTIAPGATLKFMPDGDMEIGYTNFAKFTAVGTLLEPIVFTSAASSPSEGDWDGLRFYSNTTNGTAMEHCIVEYAGDYYKPLEFHENGTKCSVMNSIIRYKGSEHHIYTYEANPTLINVVDEFGMPVTVEM